MDMDQVLLQDDNYFLNVVTSHYVQSTPDNYYGPPGARVTRNVPSPIPDPFVYNKTDVHDARPVDMSLASSYLPGIYAMLKVLVLLSMLSIMQKIGMHIDQAIIVCTACLYIDRCISLRYILDTGACALCALISVCVNASRIGIEGEPGLVNLYQLRGLWCLF